MRTQYPKRFYGLHMAEGTAEYREEGKEPYKIFVGERAISNMNASFEGKPVFVGHTENAAPDVECDGHVIRSFYNKLDGKTWCEFMVTTDKGLDAIKSGWALSNAYVITNAAQGGMWHGMDFAREVIEAEYDHLAIVDDPRYSESVIMTPEQFKEYNRKKEEELERVSNSKKQQKKQEKGMLNFFKKEKVENSKDLETMSVVLPKSKKEMDVATVINELDARLMKNEDDKEVKHVIVETENGEMSVEELINKYNEMCEKENKKNEEDEEKEKENEKEEEKEDEKKNEEDEEEKKENQKHFNSLKHAEKDALKSNRIDTSYDQVERGKNRYGSNK